MGIKQLMHLINDKAPTAVRKIPMENFTGNRKSGQIVACDASMAIYQFLIATQYTYNKGLMMLTDDQGNPTAHLVGLFNRNIQFLENGVKPVWVFDGKPPELKSMTLSKRRRLKEDSKEALEKAQEEGKQLLNFEA